MASKAFGPSGMEMPGSGHVGSGRLAADGLSAFVSFFDSLSLKKPASWGELSVAGDCASVNPVPATRVRIEPRKPLRMADSYSADSHASLAAVRLPRFPG